MFLLLLKRNAKTKKRLGRKNLCYDFFLFLKMENQVEGRVFLDVVVAKSVSILKVLTTKDEALISRLDTFLVFDHGLDRFNRIRLFNLEGDNLTGESADEDLHDVFFFC